MSLSPAKATKLIENERVRVTRWDFPPQSETGHHVHEYDYVVVPVVAGKLVLVDDEGNRTENELTVGGAYNRSVGVSHNVINESDAPVAFIEIELK
mgnify:FL=1